MFHLPDLPNAGYATTREKALSDQIMFAMRDIERDRLRLVLIVLGGADQWRIAGKDAFGSWMPDAMLDEMYAYFLLQSADGTPFQKELLEHRQNPVKIREIVRRFWPTLEAQKEQLTIMAKWSPVQRAGWHG